MAEAGETQPLTEGGEAPQEAEAPKAEEPKKGPSPVLKESLTENRFYNILASVDAAAREDWVAKAHTSPCATTIDELLKDEHSDKVQALKDEMFHRIYDVMSEEVIPEEIKMALVVKNLKFRFITSCMLTVFTLGFFLLVRPKDDDGVLVLTGQNRVILLKRARHDFFGSTGSSLLLSFMRYALLLVLLLMLPSLMWGILANGNSSSQKLSLVLMNMEMELDQDIARILREKSALVIILCVAFFLYLVFFLWTKIPYDYGTRFRRSHAASALTCAQLCFKGSNARRQGLMRLFFGKYPQQDMLDHGLPMSSNPVVGPVPLDSMDADGKFGKSSRQAFFTMLAILLTVATLVDSGFTWFERSQAALNVVGTAAFCEQATVNGSSSCSRSKCIVWAHNMKTENAFCNSVAWYLDPATQSGSSGATRRRLLEGLEGLEGGPDAEGGPGNGHGHGRGNGQGHGHGLEGMEGGDGGLEGMEGGDGGLEGMEGGDGGLEGMEGGPGNGRGNGHGHGNAQNGFYGNPLEAQAICRMYRAEGPPCCGGCRKGKVMHYLSNTFEIIKETAAILTDLCAVCVSFAAAQHVLTSTRVGDHIEIPFTKSPSATHPISTFKLTCPLALYFFQLVFSIAFPQRESKVPQFRRQRKDTELDGNTHGVKNYDLEEECATWDEFFAKHSLAAPGSTHYFPRATVPKRALGITGKEEVYGAWLESPRLTLVALIPVFICSGVVFLVFVFWPSNWHAVILPGLSNSPLSKVLTALVLGLVALLIGTLFYYILVIRSTHHAVVVTNERIFYLRYRSQCLLFCWWGSLIRVDVFRHDHDIFYADMNTMAPSIMQRFMRFQWLPGDTFAQCIWGVIHFKRRFGNAVDVFHCISHLIEEPEYMTMEECEKAGVNSEVCKNTIQASLEQKHDVVWRIKRQPDDVAREDPLLNLREKEVPLYYWSSKEIGAVSSPYHVNNDIVVTTGRIFQWQRAIYKPFDCKTCCCFGACWCTCIKKIFQADRLSTSMSFIALSKLISFSSDLDVEPPIWYDPNATPVKVPCCEKFCRAMTLCTTCDCKRAREILRDPDMLLVKPRRRGPRTQLWLMWKARFGAMMSAQVKPYAAPECDPKDLEALGVINNNHGEMMECLDKIMNTAQAKHE